MQVRAVMIFLRIPHFSSFVAILALMELEFGSVLG